MEIDPRSLPHLSKQLRDQNDGQKHKKMKFKISKIQNLKFADSRHAQLSKKVRETPGINFHQVSSKSELLGPSYDQKAESKKKGLFFKLFFPQTVLALKGFLLASLACCGVVRLWP